MESYKIMNNKFFIASLCLIGLLALLGMLLLK